MSSVFHQLEALSYENEKGPVYFKGVASALCMMMLIATKLLKTEPTYLIQALPLIRKSKDFGYD
jgi:hypothetical protein